MFNLTERESKWVKEKYDLAELSHLFAKKYILHFKDKIKFDEILKVGYIKIGTYEAPVKQLEERINVEQCFHCQKWGHLQQQCTKRYGIKSSMCRFCAKSGHLSRECQVKDILEIHRCYNCKKNHSSDTRSCQAFTDYRNSLKRALVEKRKIKDNMQLYNDYEINQNDNHR